MHAAAATARTAGWVAGWSGCDGNGGEQAPNDRPTERPTAAGAAWPASTQFLREIILLRACVVVCGRGCGCEWLTDEAVLRRGVRTTKRRLSAAAARTAMTVSQSTDEVSAL